MPTLIQDRARCPASVAIEIPRHPKSIVCVQLGRQGAMLFAHALLFPANIHVISLLEFQERDCAVSDQAIKGLAATLWL
jgi:hypothetical protein